MTFPIGCSFFVFDNHIFLLQSQIFFLVASCGNFSRISWLNSQITMQYTVKNNFSLRNINCRFDFCHIWSTMRTIYNDIVSVAQHCLTTYYLVSTIKIFLPWTIDIKTNRWRVNCFNSAFGIVWCFYFDWRFTKIHWIDFFFVAITTSNVIIDN